jgi:hypothetical protein
MYNLNFCLYAIVAAIPMLFVGTSIVPMQAFAAAECVAFTPCFDSEGMETSGNNQANDGESKEPNNTPISSSAYTANPQEETTTDGILPDLNLNMLNYNSARSGDVTTNGGDATSSGGDGTSNAEGGDGATGNDAPGGSADGTGTGGDGGAGTGGDGGAGTSGDASL